MSSKLHIRKKRTNRKKIVKRKKRKYNDNDNDDDDDNQIEDDSFISEDFDEEEEDEDYVDDDCVDENTISYQKSEIIQTTTNSEEKKVIVREIPKLKTLCFDYVMDDLIEFFINFLEALPEPIKKQSDSIKLLYIMVNASRFFQLVNWHLWCLRYHTFIATLIVLRY